MKIHLHNVVDQAEHYEASPHISGAIKAKTWTVCRKVATPNRITNDFSSVTCQACLQENRVWHLQKCYPVLETHDKRIILAKALGWLIRNEDGFRPMGVPPNKIKTVPLPDYAHVDSDIRPALDILKVGHEQQQFVHYLARGVANARCLEPDDVDCIAEFDFFNASPLIIMDALLRTLLDLRHDLF